MRELRGSESGPRFRLPLVQFLTLVRSVVSKARVCMLRIETWLWPGANISVGVGLDWQPVAAALRVSQQII